MKNTKLLPNISKLMLAKPKNIGTWVANTIITISSQLTYFILQFISHEPKHNQSVACFSYWLGTNEHKIPEFKPVFCVAY